MIATFGKRHCVLPNPQVSIRPEGRPRATSYSLLLATRYSLIRLLIARQDVIRAFPRREEIEIPEFLRQAHRLVDDALFLIVPAHLDEAGEREVLAQRMTFEAVVGQDAPQIGVAR